MGFCPNLEEVPL